jgi:hypothetical protein
LVIDRTAKATPIRHRQMSLLVTHFDESNGVQRRQEVKIVVV